MKNMTPTFTSEAEGPLLIAPKIEENTIEIDVDWFLMKSFLLLEKIEDLM